MSAAVFAAKSLAAHRFALVARSDVVIESFRPGTLERWQLGYEGLKKLNPKLILLRASGCGLDDVRMSDKTVDKKERS